MCAARSPIVSALFKRNVITSASATSTNCRRQHRFRYLSTSSSIDTGEAVTSLNNPNNSKSTSLRTVSDFQELYEATKKKFQCKPPKIERYSQSIKYFKLAFAL